jgi:hypothetical protein
MARTRFLGMAVLSVALLATQRQAVLADPAWTSAVNDLTCRVYPLSELGDDPSLGKWIAETIPDVIQPGSWNPTEPMGSRRRISYHAPSKILVVYHTTAVHAKVDAFLNDLKKALPRDHAETTAGARKMPTMDRRVTQAQYTVPASVNPAAPATPQALGYPVAAPLKQPKHLFHFIIRYEGEGLIDANVVKFAKAMNSNSATKNAQQSYPQQSMMTVGDQPSSQNAYQNAYGSSSPSLKPPPAASSGVGPQSSAPLQPQIAPATQSPQIAPSSQPPSAAPPASGPVPRIR